MSLDKVRALIGQPEDIKLEYKTTLPPSSVIAKIIASFANSAGGWLVIGIQENKNGLVVTGVDQEIPASAAVEASVSRLRPKPEIHHDFLLVDNKLLYIVKVEKSIERIIAENQNVYVRQDSSIVRIPPTETIKPVPPKLNLPLIEQILQKVTSQGIGVTEAQLGLLQQYHNLAQIVADSVDSVCPVDSRTIVDPAVKTTESEK